MDSTQVNEAEGAVFDLNELVQIQTTVSSVESESSGEEQPISDPNMFTSDPGSIASPKTKRKRFYPASFLDLTTSGQMNPSHWWASASKYQKLPIGLSELAQTLMKLPASSAGIERCFSALGSIMSKKQSRLEVEKGYKLCFIYQYY